MTCRGICHGIPHKRAMGYRLGFQYCTICRIYIHAEKGGLFCPCCGMRVRLKARGSRPNV